MVFVHSHNEITHYLKIVGLEDQIEVTAENIEDAFNRLKNLGGRMRKLTFAMKLSPNHHCTICFVEFIHTGEMIEALKNYLENWDSDPFDIIATGTDMFGPNQDKPVVLLDFTSDEYKHLYQYTSQKGKPEGGNIIRIPHFSYYGDEQGESRIFLDNILNFL